MKDTKHFLNFIEDLNENQGPFKKDEIIMIGRDIENFYPSCNKDKCIQAIKILLDTRTYQIPSKECILEAVDITMSSNTAHFCNRYFTQIDGATIGSPNSVSITDIYGAIHTDKKFIDESPVKPQNYKRYRDDTVDICKNSSKQEQNKIADWMNENICKDKIKFKVESMGDDVMKDERNEEQDSYILVPRMYSKATDIHQYLAPNSCHPDHVSKNIPTTVVHRCRTNCSDKVKDDSLFKDSLVRYKAYLLKSGYPEENIDKKFIKFALSNKRKNILQNKRKEK